MKIHDFSDFLRLIKAGFLIEMKNILLLNVFTFINASPLENHLEKFLQKNECTYDEGAWSKCQDGSQVKDDSKISLIINP